ncbi:hypothetical protein Y032_0130g1529 [Ancylostoma ceylanicum]|nr:hypothetical protein Y032_0130g1529 [Ancylostoma ceylanicum]
MHNLAFRSIMSTNIGTFIVLLEFTSALGSTPFFIARLVHILEETPLFLEEFWEASAVLIGVLDSFCLS